MLLILQIAILSREGFKLDEYGLAKSDDRLIEPEIILRVRKTSIDIIH
jgi:hypothetical protein